MKALVLEQYNRFEFKDMPDPVIGPEDVLIAVGACGICGSDVHGMDGSTGRRQPPIIMGHEAAGVIVETGADVRDWNRGDRVTFDSTVYCGVCRFCRRGRINLCDTRRVLGVSCDDYRRHGAFAEYVVVPQHIVYRVPSSLDLEQAAMVEPVSVAVHAVERTPVSLDDTAVVMGVGVIGLLVVQALRSAGCGTIIAVDLDQDKLELARTLGADVGLRADGCDVPQEVQRLTEGYGADITFEAVGIAATVSAALACPRKGGSITLVGNLSPEVELPLQAVVTRELTLYGSCASSGEYTACLDLIARDVIKVEPLISAVAPLAEGATWFKRLYNNEPGLIKVILTPQGDTQ